MVRIHQKNSFNKKDENGKIIVMVEIEASGLSTDDKPVENIINGSIFVEVDTGNVFFFNEEDAEWVEQFSFQG